MIWMHDKHQSLINKLCISKFNHILFAGFASLPEGYAAHITLSCATEVKSYVAKSDVTRAGLCEVNGEKHVKLGDQITYYTQKQITVVKLPRQLEVKAVFAQSI